MLEAIVDSTTWKVLGAILFVAAIGAAIYCGYDADQEAKGAGRYAQD